ncbi:hypothetical protein G7Z17_g10158 [Cylindrodendrum hubeiense]|uniref:non-specific serine/threonine protein kinase n=1 Tax=Cylindrodendrum hubeiense TaxID=595255 RepID=A0A9P5LCL5_9HYPO|nr:hypothetical protein G7Z17_g10158 [Cylindrodendrum hubeiense]
MAFLCLVPENDAARAVVADPFNASFASQGVLHIGHTRPKPCGTLVTLGRGDVDIYLDSPSIARIQCSFVLDPDTHVVMLQDLSRKWSTQVSGDKSAPFEHNRERQVVVCKELNTRLGIGGEKKDIFQFSLHWHQDLLYTMRKVAERGKASSTMSYQENPGMARTIDEADTVAQTPRYNTRIHVPAQMAIRYIHLEGGELGSGNVGRVYKVLNVDTGKFMALKTLIKPKGNDPGTLAKLNTSVEYALKREIEALARIRHPHIVEYVGSQGWGGLNVEIFMGLKEGTVESLVNKMVGANPTDKEASTQIVANGVLPAMLSALDFLAHNGIVHRDVKPANILYTTIAESDYHFQLGDFGLCNKIITAETPVGSPFYMAPEMYYGYGFQEKADVWSLYVTMLWILDEDNYRQNLDRFAAYCEVLGAVVSAAANNSSLLQGIQEMAIQQPLLRASAAQMLVKLRCSPTLLTTPLSCILPLVSYFRASVLAPNPYGLSSL